ncbi:MAG: hypothetical protein ABEJ66_02105, partial [Candidatus Nanohaloarchaea archaeon]
KPVSLSNFKVVVKDGERAFKSKRESLQVFDADGPNGQGDGYIAIEDDSTGKTIEGSTAGFLGKEVSESRTAASFVSSSDVPVPDCPDSQKCVASVDVSLQNLASWGSTDPNTGLHWDFVQGNPFALGQSFGTCMLYKKISGDETVNCAYDTNPPPPPPPPTPTGACGDEANEWWAYMEGPEVDDSTVGQYPSAQQACIDKETDCVIDGKDVPEGTVWNVASPFTSGFESGGDSPDWEVCLAIPGSGDTTSGDNHDWNDDGTVTDIGGEWYDLDNEKVNSYLRSNGGLLGDIDGDGSVDKHEAGFYWDTNPGVNGDFNPQGGNEGMALEDDCGPGLVGCDDSGSRTAGKSGLFYSNFTEGARDEDYHAQSIDTSVSNPYYTGYFNRIQDMSDQLDTGMDTNTYDPAGVQMWNDSDGSPDSADIFAIGQNLTSVVSNTGRVLPAGNAYYRKGVVERTNPDTGSVSKLKKVFANSFAAVARKRMTSDNGVTVNPGDGVWIDPDEIKAMNSSLRGLWTSKLKWQIDFTGPDSGLGFDTGDGDPYRFKHSGWIVWGDVRFETQDDGSLAPGLEPPMCGDDRREFLLETQGESVKSSKFNGVYACANSRNSCVTGSGTIVEKDGY